MFWCIGYVLGTAIFGWESFKWISGHGEPDSFLVGAALVFTTMECVCAACDAIVERCKP